MNEKQQKIAFFPSFLLKFLKNLLFFLEKPQKLMKNEINRK